ncbi:MAG: hypothetical protein SGPRY_011052 [Prymnesium sp.]
MSQPPPKILSTSPPPGCHPFAYITQSPLPETPAGCAGLAYGDVLLSFGSATHLRDVQSVLTSQLNQPVPVLTVDSRGRYIRKMVIPRVWDPLSPKSLLGCQMSNQCPGHHPAVAAPPIVVGKKGKASSRSEGEGVLSKQGEKKGKPSSAVSAQGEGVGGKVGKSSTMLTSAGGGDSLLSSEKKGKLSAMPGGKVGEIFPIGGGNTGENLPFGRGSTGKLPTMSTSQETAEHGSAFSGHVGSSPPPAGGGGRKERPPSFLSGLEGQVDMEDMVLAIHVACAVLALSSFLGLTISLLSRASRAFGPAAALFFVASLPTLAAGGFVIAYCLVFRDEANHMVNLYWHCLQSASPPPIGSQTQRTVWDAAAAVYQSITLTAGLLATSEGLLLLSLHAACALVGWRVVTSQLLRLINASSGLVGLGLAGLSAGLLTRAPTAFDVAALSLGLAIALLSLVGYKGATTNSRMLLKVYTPLMGGITVAMVALVGALYVLGPQGLAGNSFVAKHLEVERLYPLKQHSFEEILAHHWAKLMITVVLLSLVLCLVTLASCILRRTLPQLLSYLQLSRPVYVLNRLHPPSIPPFVQHQEGEEAEAEETAGLMGDDPTDLA